MADFLMPSLGADMEAGTIVEWLVKPGASVKRGDVVVVVETHKGAIEVEIWQDGAVAELLVAEGAEVPVGAPLARIDEATLGAGQPEEAGAASTAPAPGGAAVSVAADASATPAAVVRPTAVAADALATPAAVVRPTAVAADASATPAAVVRPAPVDRAAAVSAAVPAAVPAAAAVAPPAAGAAPAWWVRSSPAARRRAAALGLDLRAIGRGSGPDGAVVLRDVDEAPRAPAPARQTAAPPGVDPMRHAIARAMERSNREIPHYYLDHTVDVSRLLAFVAAYNADRPISGRIVSGLLFVRAVAIALRKFPDLHGTWVDDRHVPAPGIHPAVAVSLRAGGLVVPALRDADLGDVGDLMARFSDLVQRARTGRLRASELYEATTTVTSLGDRGVDGVQGVIYPPQVSLVGFGTVAERPWAIDGMLTVRPIVRVTLAGDHRASDGHRGGLFLSRIAHLLAHPEEL